MRFCAKRLFAPALMDDTERVIGNAVSSRIVLRGKRHFRSGPQHLSHSACVDDDVRANFDRPVLQKRDDVGDVRRLRLSRRVDQEQDLSAACEVGLH